MYEGGFVGLPPYFWLSALPLEDDAQRTWPQWLWKQLLEFTWLFLLYLALIAFVTGIVAAFIGILSLDIQRSQSPAQTQQGVA